MSSNDCAGGPNDQLTRNLVDDLLREPKCAYVKFVHDVPYHQACMVDGLVERVQALGTELSNARADASVLRAALTIAKQAKERWPQDVAKIEELTKELTEARALVQAVEAQRADESAAAVRERKRADIEAKAAAEAARELHYSNTVLADVRKDLQKRVLQANGWKEENEQLRRMLDGRDKRITELCCTGSLAQITDAREARFWDLIIKRGMHPNDAREMLYTAETIAKGLNKA